MVSTTVEVDERELSHADVRRHGRTEVETTIMLGDFLQYHIGLDFASASRAESFSSSSHAPSCDPLKPLKPLEPLPSPCFIEFMYRRRSSSKSIPCDPQTNHMKKASFWKE